MEDNKFLRAKLQIGLDALAKIRANSPNPFNLPNGIGEIAEEAIRKMHP